MIKDIISTLSNRIKAGSKTVKYSQYDDEYYLLYADGDYPMIDIDDEILSETKSDGMFSSPWPLIQDGYIFPISLGQPLPKKIEIVDYHDFPYTFSYRVIKDVVAHHSFNPLNITLRALIERFSVTTA